MNTISCVLPWKLCSGRLSSRRMMIGLTFMVLTKHCNPVDRDPFITLCALWCVSLLYIYSKDWIHPEVCWSQNHETAFKTWCGATFQLNICLKCLHIHQESTTGGLGSLLSLCFILKLICIIQQAQPLISLEYGYSNRDPVVWRFVYGLVEPISVHLHTVNHYPDSQLSKTEVDAFTANNSISDKD